MNEGLASIRLSKRFVANRVTGKPIFDHAVFLRWKEACPDYLKAAEHHPWNCELCVEYIKTYNDPRDLCEHCGTPEAVQEKKRFASGMCGDRQKTESYCQRCMTLPSGWKCATPGCGRDIFWPHIEDPPFDDKCNFCERPNIHWASGPT